MSVRVMAWVWAESNADPVDRLVLLAIADTANDHGAEAYPSMSTLTKKTKLHERSVQRSIRRLIEIGELTVKKNAGPRGANRYRITMTPGTAPPPAQRHPRQADTPAESHPGTQSPDPRHSATPTPGTAPPEPSFNHPEPSVEPSSSEPLPRPDVEQICTHLADRIEANGSKRPTITDAWRKAARLLLDRDGRTVDQVIRAIDWCQADAFWRSNVLSMTKLRDQYDRLRLAAQRPNGNGPPRGMVERNGRVLKAETAANLDLVERMKARDEQEAIAAIEGGAR